MDNLLNFVDKIPISQVAEWIVKKFTVTFSGLFSFIKEYGKDFLEGISKTLNMIPPIIIIILVAALAFFITRKVFLPIFTIVGLWLIYNQELWSLLIDTFTLVLIASLLSVIIGVPVGILMSKSKAAEAIITPILDFMQTMPAFVYLIPTVAFFGIGMVPGVFASLIFATPPTVRFTNLGIRQVQKDLIEASEAFGSTGMQKLLKVELPLAKATIMAGINQTVMLALSMVVTASMIGAPGLGKEVLRALQRSEVGPGFVSGLAIVILAIIIDRITQNMSKDKKTV